MYERLILKHQYTFLGQALRQQGLRRRRVSITKMSSKKLTDFFSKTTSSSPSEIQREQKQEQENNEIVIAEKYHAPENFAFPKSVVGKQQRSCQHHWFKNFTWLHYDTETDSVFCFLCVRAVKKGYVTGELRKEQAYISKGFK